jgi:hypothetical protein
LFEPMVRLAPAPEPIATFELPLVRFEREDAEGGVVPSGGVALERVCAGRDRP